MRRAYTFGMRRAVLSWRSKARVNPRWRLLAACAFHSNIEKASWLLLPEDSNDPALGETLRALFEAPYREGFRIDTPNLKIDRAVPFNRFLIDLGFNGRLHVTGRFNPPVALPSGATAPRAATRH